MITHLSITYKIYNYLENTYPDLQAADEGVSLHFIKMVMDKLAKTSNDDALKIFRGKNLLSTLLNSFKNHPNLYEYTANHNGSNAIRFKKPYSLTHVLEVDRQIEDAIKSVLQEIQSQHSAYRPYTKFNGPVRDAAVERNSAALPILKPKKSATKGEQTAASALGQLSYSSDTESKSSPTSDSEHGGIFASSPNVEVSNSTIIYRSQFFSAPRSADYVQPVTQSLDVENLPCSIADYDTEVSMSSPILSDAALQIYRNNQDLLLTQENSNEEIEDYAQPVTQYLDLENLPCSIANYDIEVSKYSPILSDVALQIYGYRNNQGFLLTQENSNEEINAAKSHMVTLMKYSSALLQRIACLREVIVMILRSTNYHYFLEQSVANTLNVIVYEEIKIEKLPFKEAVHCPIYKADFIDTLLIEIQKANDGFLTFFPDEGLLTPAQHHHTYLVYRKVPVPTLANFIIKLHQVFLEVHNLVFYSTNVNAQLNKYIKQKNDVATFSSTSSSASHIYQPPLKRRATYSGEQEIHPPETHSSDDTTSRSFQLGKRPF